MSENAEKDTTEVAAPAPELTPAPDNVKSIESAKQKHKPNKHEQKQIQKYIERLRRHMTKGFTEEQARQMIAKEDYDNLSPDKKIQRLETLVSNLFNMTQQDINNLRHNDGELAFALDVNFKAFAKILVKLGVPLDEQQVLIAEAQAEVKVDEERRKAEAEERQKKAQEAAVLAQAKETSSEPAEEPPASPEGATEFSG